MEEKANSGPIAIVGAGVIGAAVACALAREGRKVLLLDRAEPGIAGASYGNVGHIAAELVEPLPSRDLLFGFWRELTALDGPLDFRLRHLPGMLPWIARFAGAAFRREENTKHLAPLVRESRSVLERWLRELRRPELLRCNGHYEIWLSARAIEHARTQSVAMDRLGIPTELAPAEIVDLAWRQAQRDPLAHGAPPGRRDRLAGGALHAGDSARENAAIPDGGDPQPNAAAGLWFPESGHVTDPLEIVRAFAHAVMERGGEIRKAHVLALEVDGDGVRVITTDPTSAVAPTLPSESVSTPLSESASMPSSESPLLSGSTSSVTRVSAVVVCTGAWSRHLLERFGLNVPMESARGYHVEMPNQAALVDAPVIYSDQRVLVTPMSGRLRASSYMEFASPDAPPNPRRPRRLREKVRSLGYGCPLEGPSWVGPRPVLPDYLPGIGRVPGAPNIYYAIGHQHIGLTLAAVTGELVADLVAGRQPRHNISAFDLKRFG